MCQVLWTCFLAQPLEKAPSFRSYLTEGVTEAQRKGGLQVTQWKRAEIFMTFPEDQPAFQLRVLFTSEPLQS